MSNPWTPGPWSLNADQRHVGADGETLVGEVGRLNPAEFARVMADRCLITSAPEMVEALLGCVEHMEHSTPQGRAAWETATALLARIRGDAP